MGTCRASSFCVTGSSLPELIAFWVALGVVALLVALYVIYRWRNRY